MLNVRVSRDPHIGEVTLEIKDVAELTFESEEQAYKFLKDILVSNGMPY